MKSVLFLLVLLFTGSARAGDRIGNGNGKIFTSCDFYMEYECYELSELMRDYEYLCQVSNRYDEYCNNLEESIDHLLEKLKLAP